MDPADIARALRSVVKGGVDDSARRRAEYSSDASNYRVVPAVVVFPRDTEDMLAAAEVSRRTGTPLTTRGAGTSIAGNAVGPGIVLDTSRHLNRVLDIDPQARTARVEPGVVLASLQDAARPHRLRFGPEPSTWSRATLGGMIGNNACGAHALAYGRTADNVLELDVIDGTGRRLVAGRGLDPVPGLDALVDREPGADAHRVRPAAPPGVRLLAGAPAAGARGRPGQGAGRHRGHRGHHAGRHGPAGPGAAGLRAGRARLPRCGRPRPTRCPPCCSTRRSPWKAWMPG